MHTENKNAKMRNNMKKLLIVATLAAIASVVSLITATMEATPTLSLR